MGHSAAKPLQPSSSERHPGLHEAGKPPEGLPESLVDEAVEESFPASDPPALSGSTRLLDDDSADGTKRRARHREPARRKRA
jgi:hypothetical protein